MQFRVKLMPTKRIKHFYVEFGDVKDRSINKPLADLIIAFT